MNSNLRTLFAMVALLVAPAVLAQHETFNVNPDASDVNFTLNGSDHGTQGTFHVEKGSIEFDPKAATLSGLVTVSAASGKTGNSSRDKKMMGEVLDATHFTDVSFAPTRYQGTIAPSGDSTIQAAGIFTLHGTPHEITVPMQIHIEGTACTATTSFTVPYVKWGLKDPSIFMLHVAKEVQVNLKLVGLITSAKPGE